MLTREKSGPVFANPDHVSDVDETNSTPKEAKFSIEFDRTYYSITKYLISRRVVPSWSQESFGMLVDLFQLSITGISNLKTPIISIPRGE